MLFQAKKHEDRNRLSRFEQNYGTSDCPNVENVHYSARLTVSLAGLVECTEYKIKLCLVFEILIGASLNSTFFHNSAAVFQ